MTTVSSIAIAPGALPLLGHLVPLLRDPLVFLASLPGRAGRRARAELAAMTNREHIESVVRLCFGNPTLAPEHRLAEAAPGGRAGAVQAGLTALLAIEKRPVGVGYAGMPTATPYVLESLRFLNRRSLKLPRSIVMIVP